MRVTKARGLSSHSQAFLHVVLEQLLPGRDSDYADMITDGSNDRGIDAVEITESDGQADILLFQAKYRESLATTDKTINDAEVLKISAFLHELFDKRGTLLKTGNLQLTEAVERIWALHEKGCVCRYRIILCSNDQGLSASARALLEGAIASLHGVAYETYGPADLIRDIGVRGRQRESGSLQVIGKEIFERTDGDIRGLIASVDAGSFVELIRAEDGKSAKRHLFDDNLRVFLGTTGGYNGEIISTATSNDSHLFWYLNNGITITCRDYSYNKGHVSPVVRMDDFQIVNGAQTSHSLIEATRRTGNGLDNVVLTVRIYATGRNDIAERVAVATGSQARIQSRDLRANHPVLKKIEIAFADRGYFL
jgi:AIPR protein